MFRGWLLSRGTSGGCGHLMRAAADNSPSSRWFKTLLVAPEAPVQHAPLSGVSGMLPGLTFRWRTERLSDRYQLQLAMDSPFDSTIYDNTAIRDTQCTVVQLRYATRYFWRVRGWNSEGARRLLLRLVVHHRRRASGRSGIGGTCKCVRPIAAVCHVRVEGRPQCHRISAPDITGCTVCHDRRE